MATMRTIAALLLVLVAVAAAGDLPSKQQFRRWVRECRKESVIAKKKPLYAMKKTISGMYDPMKRNAFKKSQFTFTKFEFMNIRKPSEAEKCLMECIAEKQGMINGSQLDSAKIMKVMTALGNHINKVSQVKKVNMTLLKRYTGKCIVGSHGSAQNCELGFELFTCLKTAIKESLYEKHVQSSTETTYTPSTDSSAEATESSTSMASTTASSQPERFVRRPYMGYRAHHMGYRRFPPPPSSDMAPPPMPLNGMPPPPPPMAFNGAPGPHPMPMAYRFGPPPPPSPLAPPPMAYGIPPPPPQPMMYQSMPPSGPAPSYVAYRQGSGLVQVYGENPSPWRQHMRGMHGGPRMMHPMV